MTHQPLVLTTEQRSAAERSLSRLKLAFVGFVASWGIATLANADDAAILRLVGSAGVVGCWIGYLGYLWLLSGLLGKSRVTWIGGTVLLGPIGVLVSFGAMLNEARKANL